MLCSWEEKFLEKDGRFIDQTRSEVTFLPIPVVVMSMQRLNPDFTSNLFRRAFHICSFCIRNRLMIRGKFQDMVLFCDLFKVPVVLEHSRSKERKIVPHALSSMKSNRFLRTLNLSMYLLVGGHGDNKQ